MVLHAKIKADCPPSRDRGRKPAEASRKLWGGTATPRWQARAHSGDR